MLDLLWLIYSFEEVRNLFELADYRADEIIYQGGNSIFYQGVRNTDQTPVIIKKLNREYPSQLESSRFQQEYSLLKELSIDGTPKPLGLEKDGNTLLLILDNAYQGTSLVDLFSTQALPLQEFFPIAIGIADILAKIHQNNIIHRDIKPHNILLNTDNQKLQFIDFGMATQLQSEKQEAVSANSLEGTLAYISPEQTGRMNRAIDYRTDFYSLGITLYELLAGQLPFSATDPMEVIYCHIAKTPTPVYKHNDAIPQAVSDIISKLMAKNAEDRYQSAIGLTKDLQACQQQWQQTGAISDFYAGQHDVSARFQIPQKLYGRNTEINILLNAFDQVSTGTTQMMLVAGYSGIGKSVLVHEVHKPIVEKRGYFISGKFDQFKRNQPYYAFILAFQELMQHLLTESEDQLASWKSKLLKALGTNGQVIINVIPNVELIIGPQPAVQQLAPTEAQNRFSSVFENFIKVFTQREHPLVLFIDDLQWADVPSLTLLKLVMTDPDIQYLLFIGAYRDNEVDPSHPYVIAESEIKKTGATVYTITLSPLKVDDLNQLIADTLHTGTTAVTELARLVMEKSGGNPFFVNEFLKNLHQEKLLTFDFDQLLWCWNIEDIQAQSLTDNVIELMVIKLKKLPDATQNALKLGACIGASFDLKALAVISESSLVQSAKDLWPAVKEGIIFSLGEEHKLLAGMGQETDQEYKIIDRFRHDRIQQAAYSLIAKDQRKSIHLKIARLLLSSVIAEELEDQLFNITDQYNTARELIEDDDEKLKLAELNLRACIKAKSSTAYGPAVGHAQIGKSLLPDDAWISHYELTFNLYREGAETEYLAGHLDEVESQFKHILEHARDNMDKAIIYKAMMQYYVSIARHRDNLGIGIKALKGFDIELPDLDETDTINTEFQKEYAQYENYLNDSKMTIADIVNLPEMDNPKMSRAMGILMSMIDAAFYGNPNILGLLMIKQINLCLKHGNTPNAALAYSWFGLVLIYMEKIDDAFEFAKLGVAYAEKGRDPLMLSRTYHGYGCFVAFYKESITTSIVSLKKSFIYGTESGDVNFANYCVSLYNRWAFHQGLNLQDIKEESAVSLHFMHKTQNQPIYEFHHFVHYTYLSLLGLTPDKFILHDSFEEEQALVKKWMDVNGALQVDIYAIQKLILHYLYGDYEGAKEFGALAEEYKWGIKPAYDVIHINLYYSLTLTALYPDATSKEQTAYWAIIETYTAELKTWSEHCEANYLHKYLLVEAEKARIQGKTTEAMSLYQQSIDSARQHNFQNFEALGNELYAKFWYGLKQDRIALLFLKDAHYLYSRWGAITKVQDLEAQYPQLKISNINTAVPLTTTTETSASKPLNSTQLLDMDTITRASQALSGEVVLDKLLEKLMGILIENSGAEIAVLLLPLGDGSLAIEAEGSAEHLSLMQAEPLADSKKLAVGVVQYAVRTQENVVLEDAAQTGNFTQDPYIKAHQSQSILCTPVVHQGRLVGVIYLENNVTCGAFTPARIRVLQVICAQAAISIENAALYATLEEKVKERTQDLHDTMNQLIEAEKMAALGQLVGGVAHEINTPVGICVTSTSLLQELTQQLERSHRNSEISKKEFERFLSQSTEITELIMSNICRTADLVKRFKGIAVNQEGEQKHIFKLKPRIEEICINLSSDLQQKQHSIDVNCDQSLALEGYPVAFALVMSNLVMNSITHGFKDKEGGKINIEVQEDNKNILINYRDDGVGINAENISKIFEPFFTTNMGANTGLGMHIVYNIITQQFCGNIHCESELNKGVCFTLSLPGTVT